MSRKTGVPRERQVRERLEVDGWAVVRAAGSLGCIDLVAGRAGRTLAIEVKADLKEYGPFNNFGPSKRKSLLALAAKAGWEAVLIWWPPYGEMQLIWPKDWPLPTNSGNP